MFEHDFDNVYVIEDYNRYRLEMFSKTFVSTKVIEETHEGERFRNDSITFMYIRNVIENH